jgi:hypothetical protein
MAQAFEDYQRKLFVLLSNYYTVELMEASISDTRKLLGVGGTGPFRMCKAIAVRFQQLFDDYIGFDERPNRPARCGRRCLRVTMR